MDNNENFHESILMDDTHKFLPETNAESEVNKVKIQFNGLSKEEVMATAKDPQWVRLRWILLILFWVIWIGMLAAAAIIIVFTDQCPCVPKQTWQQKELIYQVDVGLFQDSNGDGVGDLDGLLSRLKYLKENVGAGALSLSSSLLNENNEVNPKYVAKTDIDQFRKELKSNDMYVIIDIPYASVSNGSTSLNDWLNKRGFDGVRIVNIPDSIDSKLITELKEKVKKISDETFETKFISFYPLKREKYNGTTALFNQFSLSESAATSYETIEPLTRKKLDSKKCECNSDEWPLLILSSENDLKLSNLKIAHGIHLLLKGTPFIQYGDEINMKSASSNRYMKWNDKLNCGFTTNNNSETSSLISKDCHPNVEEETSHGAGNRLIRLYQNLKDLRRKNAFLFGDVILSDTAADTESNKNLLTFVREADKFEGYLIAANIGETSKKYDFKHLFKNVQLPDTAKCVYFDWFQNKKHNDFEIDTIIQTDRVFLNPGEFLVLSFTR